MRPTDTALAFRGEAEWVIASLLVLGVPEETAADTFSVAMGCAPGMVPDGTGVTFFRLCAECVDNAGLDFPAPVLWVKVPRSP